MYVVFNIHHIQKSKMLNFVYNTNQIVYLLAKYYKQFIPKKIFFEF